MLNPSIKVISVGYDHPLISNRNKMNPRKMELNAWSWNSQHTTFTLVIFLFSLKTSDCFHWKYPWSNFWYFNKSLKFSSGLFVVEVRRVLLVMSLNLNPLQAHPVNPVHFKLFISHRSYLEESSLFYNLLIQGYSINNIYFSQGNWYMDFKTH